MNYKPVPLEQVKTPEALPRASESYIGYSCAFRNNEGMILVVSSDTREHCAAVAELLTDLPVPYKLVARTVVTRLRKT